MSLKLCPSPWTPVLRNKTDSVLSLFVTVQEAFTPLTHTHLFFTSDSSHLFCSARQLLSLSRATFLAFNSTTILYCSVRLRTQHAHTSTSFRKNPTSRARYKTSPSLRLKPTTHSLRIRHSYNPRTHSFHNILSAYLASAQPTFSSSFQQIPYSHHLLDGSVVISSSFQQQPPPTQT